MLEDEPAPREWTPPWVWAALLALLAWGIFPFRRILHHYPWGADAPKWVKKAALDNPDWFHWVFLEHHFVGYRPVTAGSFTLNHAIAGYNAEFYRLTDIGLHCAVAVALAALFRRLTGRPSIWMLLPAFLFLGHPVVEEVLPNLARRSYVLAAALGCTGLVLWFDGLRRPGIFNRVTLLATALIAGALLSNEVSFVLLPMLILFTVHEKRGEENIRRSLARCVLPWVLAVPMVWARWMTLGWSGGYVKHYFAYTANGKKSLTQVEAFNFDHIVAASFDYVWFPVSFYGRDPWILGGSLGLFLVASFYFWSVVVEPLLNLEQRERRVPLLLGVWFAGHAILYGLSKTWFWRQGYPMVLPMALLVSYVAASTVQRFWGDWKQLVPRAIPQLTLIVALLWHSPIFRGMNPSSFEGRARGSLVISQLRPVLDELEGPAHVFTVLPLRANSLPNTMAWLESIYAEEQIEFTSLAYGVPTKGLVRVEGKRLMFGEKAKIQRRFARVLAPGRSLGFSALQRPNRADFVLVPNSHGRWILLPMDDERAPRGR